MRKEKIKMGSIGEKLQPELKGNYVDTSKHKVKAEHVACYNGGFTLTYKDNVWKRMKK